MSADQSESDLGDSAREGVTEGADEYRDPVEEEVVKTYRCRACGAMFSSRKELEMHWNKAHASWKKRRRRR
ncbi:MAG: hypothetical protein ACP5LG_00005 [Conexivisphaera sp.]